MKILGLFSIVSFAVFLVTMLFLLQEVHSSNSLQLEERIGKETLHTILNAKNVTIFQVESKHPNSFTITSKEHELSNEDQKALIKLLTNDSSFLFDRTKKSLFIPTCGAEFKGNKDITVLFSPYSAQLKFIAEEKNSVLDYDSVAKEINDIIEKEVSL
jgi:hypothetical protein